MRIPTPKFECPFCGAMIATRYKAGQPLSCPSCERKLKPSRRYLNAAFWEAVGLTIVLCFAIGLRGRWLAIGAVLLWFPVDLARTFIYVRIFPPKFEEYHPRGSNPCSTKG